MKITPKGIGWLIFGVIVCASATESIGIIPALSTIALGLVFILVYVMKQFFKPRSLGWYIVGGMMLSFSIESGFNSDTLIALVIAFASLLWFYFKNKNELDYMFSGVVNDELDDFGYLDEDTYPDPIVYETTVEEVVEETTDETADETADVPVETEITTAEEEAKSEEDEPALQTWPPEGPEEGIVEIDLPVK